MKIKDGFLIRKVASQYVVMPCNNDINFNGMISLNESGAFLFNLLKENITKDDMLQAMLNEYDVSKEQALKDIDKFIKVLQDNNLLDL